jgi:hypothetical protein
MECSKWNALSETILETKNCTEKKSTKVNVILNTRTFLLFFSVQKLGSKQKITSM